jgi:LPXTG-site transpeptidase (sortase) family protein
MTLKEMISRFKGFWLIIPGIILLFIGASGAFGLFEGKAAPEYDQQEVPRDMIEKAYSSDGSEFTSAVADEGSAPLFVPLQATPAVSLPTMQAASSQDLAHPEEMINSPTLSIQEMATMESENITEQMTPGPGSDATDVPVDTMPKWIHIPAIAVDAPVVPAKSTAIEVAEGDRKVMMIEWEAPDEPSVGWHTSSAKLGQVGNTVLNGHHNAYGKVFQNLAYLQEGDLIQVYGGGQWFNYVVINKMVLPERDVSIEKRIENASWIMPSQDERLTLVTCWPEQTNTHRLIIVASPIKP